MAYMDGQMSASEALEFERSLSPEDKERLDYEVRLESAICDSLSGQECCPVALWNSLSTRMKNQSPKRLRLMVWQRRFVALAASIAIVATSSVIYRELTPGQMNVAAGLEITEDTLADFARHTEVPGTREATQRFLDEHQIALTLISTDSGQLDGHHPVKLLGACVGSCPTGSLVEVRLTCCDKPVKLIIAKEGSSGALQIRRASRCGRVKASRVANGFVTALVGDFHGNTALLDLLQPTSGNIV